MIKLQIYITSVIINLYLSLKKPHDEVEIGEVEKENCRVIQKESRRVVEKKRKEKPRLDDDTSGWGFFKV